MRLVFGGAAVLGVLFAWGAGCAQDPVLQHAPPLAGSAGSGGSATTASTTQAGPGATTTSTGAGTTGTGGSTSSSTGSGVLIGDVLTPSEVYLDGTLAEGSCGRDALVHWSSPNDAATGFDCYFDGTTAQIRPTDGRLLYMNASEHVLREFRCDECPFSGTSGMYPPNVLANDPVVPTPPCDNASNTLFHFRVAPDGKVLHTCFQDDYTWYDATGAVAYASPGKDDQLLHLGYGGVALTQTRLFDLAAQTSLNLTGLPNGPGMQAVQAVRAVAPDKFLLALSPASGTGADAEELWQVDATGAATKLGVFPPLPAGTTSGSGASGALDDKGVFFEFGEGAMVFEDIILRRTIGGVSEVVYDEATKPLVKIHISALITGP